MGTKKRRGGKKRRRRASREDVRRNAQKGAGGPNWMNLPDGVRSWKPEKKGVVLLNFLPYEVSDPNHPDNVEEGVLWYKRIFRIHHGVGAENLSLVCPRSAHKKCPICEERDRLSRDDSDGNEEAIKGLKTQQYAAFNIVDPDDEDAVAVFAFSTGKFWSTDRGMGGLKKELDEGDDEVLDFYHCEGGMTVKARFSEDSFSGNKFIKVTKVDFRERDDMDEEEMLEKVVDLDQMLNILPYDKIRQMFLQITDDDEDEDEEEEEEEEEKPKRKSNKKKARRCVDCDELLKNCICDDDEDEDEDEDEEDEDEPPAKKKPRKGKKKKKKNDEPECPEGGTFGKDVDEFEACDDCELWEACEEASDS